MIALLFAEFKACLLFLLLLYLVCSSADDYLVLLRLFIIALFLRILLLLGRWLSITRFFVVRICLITFLPCLILRLTLLHIEHKYDVLFVALFVLHFTLFLDDRLQLNGLVNSLPFTRVHPLLCHNSAHHLLFLFRSLRDLRLARDETR